MSDLVVRLQRTQMTFPRELRHAIPDLPTCEGRVLALESITGATCPARFGMHVKLQLLVQETGKLQGKYTLTTELQPEAARQLAEALNQLADQADTAQTLM